MQAGETVSSKQSFVKSTSTSRPLMNIASVRATSLRSSGLRAASSRRGTAHQEKQSASTRNEEQSAITRMSSCFSSSLSMASSTHLSYTDSLDPGEDAQLKAIAMVDTLVNLNASPVWDTLASSIVAELSCLKGPQNTKGIQSLARNADAKNQQGKMGIYDWIDSQPDENGDIEHVFPTCKGQQEQLKEGKEIENRKARQGRVSDVAGTNDTCNAVVMDKEASSIEQQSNKVQDTDARYEKGDAEIMDIGANTQIAVDAMDFLRCGMELNDQRAPSNEKALFASSDRGHDTETDIAANNEGILHSERANAFSLGFSNDTQSAIDVIDAMRHEALTDIRLSEVKATSSVMSLGNDTQTALDAIEIMRHGIEPDVILPKEEAPSCLCDIGIDTQMAIEAIDVLRHEVETDPVLSYAECLPMSKQGLRGADVRKHANGGNLHAKRKFLPKASALGRNGRQLSRATTGEKLVCKKGSSRERLKCSKSQRSALVNLPAVPVFDSNKRFLLDFSSAMVPRRKRNRLCVPRSNFNVFGCLEHDFHPQPILTVADKQAQSGKSARVELQKSDLLSECDGKSPKAAVLLESTNGESVRRTKRKVLTELDCYTSLEGSRKRRKCESRCIFALFSHSLSEATIKQQKKMLIKLGGHVATLAAKATHFVADSFTRSRNMLEIMAAGKVVVTTMWLKGCSQAEYFVDENSYILQDTQKEKQWGFCMRSSLATSSRKPLFKGMKVMVSPTTAPDFETIKAVVEGAGGQAMQRLPSSSHSKANEITSISFVIGSEEDYDFCAEFLKKGCKVYSTELILHGVVTQSLDFSRNGLFEDCI